MNDLAKKSEAKVDQLIENPKERFQVSEKTWKVSPEGYKKRLKTSETEVMARAGIRLTNDKYQVLLMRSFLLYLKIESFSSRFMMTGQGFQSSRKDFELDASVLVKS